MESGKPARQLEFDEDERKMVGEMFLLTMKPMMYVLNVDEQTKEVAEGNDRLTNDGGAEQVRVCAKLEAELADLSPGEAREYLKELGMTETGLDKIIVAGYKLLNLVTYFTSGEPETRAWTVSSGAKGPEAAGVIHTDFVKGYIKADVVNWRDFVDAGGWNKIKETGKLRLEGKDYVVADGDVCYFHIA